MKYIDADKIRTEIKRLKAENNCGTDEFIAAKDIAYDKVFDFLDTFEEPVSDCHDLEEEVKRYLCEDCSGDDEPTVSEIAHHFVEWQKAKMMEGAVEGYITLTLTGVLTVAATIKEGDNLRISDKVKIIIVKEGNNGH